MEPYYGDVDDHLEAMEALLALLFVKFIVNAFIGINFSSNFDYFACIPSLCRKKGAILDMDFSVM